MIRWFLRKLEANQDGWEFHAIAWTWPTIAIFVSVVVAFTRQSVVTIRKMATAQPLRPRDWIVLGIWIGFLGGSVDNEYWGFAWGFNYIEWDVAQKLFQFGVYSNLPFRQFTGVASAYCHLRAVTENTPPLERRHKTTWLHYWVLVNVVVGYLIALGLFWIK